MNRISLPSPRVIQDVAKQLFNRFYYSVITKRFFPVVTTSEIPPPNVTTKYGIVEGKWGVSYDGRKYAIFEGLPYAKPPVGNLRFEVCNNIN